ncbi:hypothetical protein [Aurantiacibacter gangjinensis]|uniref:Uncharacterized protein n=1 Tax=Aurantiacibacter gangjinensis TaxID=502682 RepID=A0A0G9MLU9_9SPHN|nr:hypothetical protein [Aurantiacibacter gangjinensis]APE27691.1 hypothetical protein BMF35_a0862 [Aurantiacibacter gangjinensis]KLE31701.1 hypothetical protein AAW01_09305 [Aurantiacibacter gangjinensis]
MTDKRTDRPESQEQRQAKLAPETHNDEQDDHRMQAQEVSEQAQALTEETGSPTESAKSDNKSGLMNDSTQDTVDHMRDMESSGRIDMGAYEGEPNHDDNEDKYGKANKVDPELTSDGADVPGE